MSKDDRLTARQMCEQIASCGYDIAGIYREMRPDIGGEKARDLKLGVEKYLGLD